MSHFTEKKVHSVLRMINTPMRIWTKYQMMSYQSTRRKMNPSKIEKAGDNATAAALLAEKTRLLELSAFQLHMDREICNKT